jgi:hypothetical protein
MCIFFTLGTLLWMSKILVDAIFKMLGHALKKKQFELQSQMYEIQKFTPSGVIQDKSQQQ